MGTLLELIPQIKRDPNTPDGQLFKYLRSYNASIGIVEMVMTTLRSFWLPLVLEASGVSAKDLRKVAIASIAQLQAQIYIIERLCGVSGLPQPAMPVSSSLLTDVVEHSHEASMPRVAPLVNDDEDDDDEMVMVNWSDSVMPDDLNPGIRLL